MRNVPPVTSRECHGARLRSPVLAPLVGAKPVERGDAGGELDQGAETIGREASVTDVERFGDGLLGDPHRVSEVRLRPALISEPPTELRTCIAHDPTGTPVPVDMSTPITPETVSPPDTLRSVKRSAKSLTPEERAHVREVLRQMQRDRTQTALATELGVTQQTVSAVLGGTTPPGYPMARAMAAVLKCSVERVLSGIATAPSTMGELPGWQAAAEQVVRLQRAPRYAVRAVATAPSWAEIQQADEELILALVSLWFRYTPQERIAALATAEAEQDRRDRT